MKKFKKELNEIKDRLKQIEENTKKPHWVRTVCSFMLLTIGLLGFNLEGTKILNGFLEELNLNATETSFIATLLIILSLFLYRR